jgi:pimeloyl-ACP methyl ester carboxylesterase
MTRRSDTSKVPSLIARHTTVGAAGHPAAFVGYTLAPMAGVTDQIEVDGLRIAYEREGKGPPLILLHGYVGDGRGTWHRQLDGLSDEFTVVAWDAPGAGASSDPPEGFGLPDYADCLAGFVDALGLGRPHVAGLSFGGTLALELYRRHPALPRTLILASAYAGWAGSLPPEVVGQRLQQALDLADLPPDHFVREVAPTLFSGSASAETVRAFTANASGFHPAGLRAMARSSAEADLRDVLPRIDVPTLLLYGDDDVRAPLNVAEDLHAAISTSRLIVLPGIGHLINIEAGERFNAEIRAFLQTAQR